MEVKFFQHTSNIFAYSRKQRHVITVSKCYRYGTSLFFYLGDSTPIRPHSDPGFPFPAPNPGPYGARFKKEPESAVFLQSDKIKRSHIGDVRPIFSPGRVLDCPGKRICTNAFMAQLRALYEVQFGRISANGAVKRDISRAGRNGTFYGGTGKVTSDSPPWIPALGL
jgi:hypothetical protein